MLAVQQPPFRDASEQRRRPSSSRNQASFVFAGIALGSALAGVLYQGHGYRANLLGSLGLLLLASLSLLISARQALSPQQPARSGQA